VQENSQKHKNVQIQLKLAHMLFIHFKVWKHHKAMKIYQETYDSFCRDFCEEVNTHRDSDSKHIGAISKKTQEIEQRPKACG